MVRIELGDTVLLSQQCKGTEVVAIPLGCRMSFVHPSLHYLEEVLQNIAGKSSVQLSALLF